MLLSEEIKQTRDKLAKLVEQDRQLGYAVSRIAWLIAFEAYYQVLRPNQPRKELAGELRRFGFWR